MPDRPTPPVPDLAERLPLHVHALIDSLTWGGAEMLLADLVAAGPAAGIRFTVGFLNDVDGSPAAPRLRSRGVEPELVQMDGLLSPRTVARLRRHLRALAPDLVHTHLAYADLLGGVAARSLGIPALSTVHVMRWEDGPRERLKARLVALARRRCMMRVLAVSESARQAYLAQGWDSPGHVVAVPNGIAERPRPGSGPGVRAELGLDAEDVVVTMLTVLRPGKGHDVALAALAMLRSRFPRLRLLIAGDGPERARIEALAAPLGAAVRLAGHRDDVMHLLDATDILVQPSSADAFPTSLLEAMAAAVPVLATRVGGIPEIVVEGQTGILIEPPPTAGALGDGLAALLADPGLRRRLGTAGAGRFAERFTAERWSERVRTAYDRALADAGGRPPRPAGGGPAARP